MLEFFFLKKKKYFLYKNFWTFWTTQHYTKHDYTLSVYRGRVYLYSIPLRIPYPSQIHSWFISFSTKLSGNNIFSFGNGS